MSVFEQHPRWRWAVPASVAALIGGSVVAGTSVATAGPGLPDKTPQQLVADVAKADTTSLSGTVQVVSNLGLPQLPNQGAQSADAMALLSGTSTVRVWSDGADRSRVSLQGQASQSDIIQDGRSVWLWSSASKTATHATLPAHSKAYMPKTDMPKTPEEAAKKVLAMMGTSTNVTTESAVTIAGRDAYQLVLTPKQTNPSTLVRRATIAIDAATSQPLRVQMYSTKQSDVALQVGYTSVTFAKPNAAIFNFKPPSDAKVVEAEPHKANSSKGAKPAEPKVVGSAWSQVVVAKLPAGALNSMPPGKGADSSAARDDSSAAAALNALPTVSGKWGSGKLLTGSLFSAVLTRDGRVAAGAVAPDALYSALGK